MYMMKARCFILMFMLLQGLYSCSSNVFSALEDVESYIQERPDSALAVLQAIDRNTLESKKSKAKFSLLYAMALDKNYIDTTDVSVIMPAVEYYSHHGSADDRLKMHYYRARIAENTGDNEDALKWLVTGEKYSEKCKDNVALGRYFSLKGAFYYHMLDFSRALENEQQAYKYHSLSTNKKGKIISLLNQSDIYRSISEFDKSSSILDTLELLHSEIGPAQLCRYYAHRIMNAIYLDKNPKPYLDGVFKDIANPVYYPLPEMGRAYNYLSQTDSALFYLSFYDKEKKGENPSYEIAMFTAYANQGDYQNAYSVLSKYTDSQLHKYVNKLLEDTKNIEERYLSENELLKAKIRNTVSIIICLCLALILVSGFIYGRKKIKEKTSLVLKLKQSYDELMSEKEALVKIHSNEILDEEAKILLSERIESIEHILVNKADSRSVSAKNALTELNMIVNDKKYFLSTLALLFTINHQEFVRYLKLHKLTDIEIGHCCLYSMGMNGKDVGILTNSTNNYNISSGIRQKLQINQGETNLSAYIQRLLTKTEAGN